MSGKPYFLAKICADVRLLLSLEKVEYVATNSNDGGVLIPACSSIFQHIILSSKTL